MRLLAITWLFLPQLWCAAQDSTWVLVSNTTAQCEWLSPQPPTIWDTLNVQMYALSIDSTLGMSVHVIDNALPDTSASGLFGQALTIEGDTLRAMAQVMILASGGRLMEIRDTTVQEVPVLDFAMSHPIDGVGKDEVSFLRLIYRSETFVCFSVTAPEERVNDAVTLSNSLRSSIVLL